MNEGMNDVGILNGNIRIVNTFGRTHHWLCDWSFMGYVSVMCVGGCNVRLTLLLPRPRRGCEVLFSPCLYVCLSVCLCVRPIFWYFISRLLEEILI